jgi:hypothetical protein
MEFPIQVATLYILKHHGRVCRTGAVVVWVSFAGMQNHLCHSVGRLLFLDFLFFIHFYRHVFLFFITHNYILHAHARTTLI